MGFLAFVILSITLYGLFAFITNSCDDRTYYSRSSASYIFGGHYWKAKIFIGIPLSIIVAFLLIVEVTGEVDVQIEYRSECKAQGGAVIDDQCVKVETINIRKDFSK